MLRARVRTLSTSLFFPAATFWTSGAEGVLKLPKVPYGVLEYTKESKASQIVFGFVT
jgi:hypothetical protein